MENGQYIKDISIVLVVENQTMSIIKGLLMKFCAATALAVLHCGNGLASRTTVRLNVHQHLTS